MTDSTNDPIAAAGVGTLGASGTSTPASPVSSNPFSGLSGPDRFRALLAALFPASEIGPAGELNLCSIGCQAADCSSPIASSPVDSSPASTSQTGTTGQQDAIPAGEQSIASSPSLKPASGMSLACPSSSSAIERPETVPTASCFAMTDATPALSTASTASIPPTKASSIALVPHIACSPPAGASSTASAASTNSLPTGPSQADILEHLGRDFSDPVGLLAGMTKANVLVSGSRVLEMFIPGSCDEYSDWDWFCQGSARSVGQAIGLLEQAGVVIGCPFQSMTDIALAARGTVAVVHIEDFEALYCYAHSEMWCNRVPLQAGAVLNSISDALLNDNHCETILLVHGVLVEIRRGKRSHAYGNGYAASLNIVTGWTTIGKTARKVQIISTPRKSPLAHIFDFYSTPSQVIVCGLGAIMFHWDAQREGIYLSSNTQRKKSAEAATRKYAKRGFTFTMATSTDYVVKHLGTPGHGAKMVLFDGIPLRVSPDLYAVRLAHFKNLIWSEYAGETQLMCNPTFEMRAVLKRNRNARIALRAAGFKDDSDLNVARSHSAFFGGGHHSYPDEVIGL